MGIRNERRVAFAWTLGHMHELPTSLSTVTLCAYRVNGCAALAELEAASTYGRVSHQPTKADGSGPRLSLCRQQLFMIEMHTDCWSHH